MKCTLFSIASNNGRIIYGRNFDNEVCNVVAVKYQPVNGYRSIGFTRLSDLGFEKDEDLLSLPLEKRAGLLAAPCFTADGMNEKGVVFGLASVRKQFVVIDPEKETVFLMRLCREILDHAANVGEAVAIAGKYNIYDEKEGANYSIAHHLLVSDAKGDSVVFENSGGQMRVIGKTLPWQLAANSPLYKVNEKERTIDCQRYQILTALMEKNREKMNWQKGMQFLRRVAVKGSYSMSCWSSVYDIGERTIYVVIQKKYQTPLKLTF
jgi:penicillin V acylase-like amidase (Ntn superfamily)